MKSLSNAAPFVSLWLSLTGLAGTLALVPVMPAQAQTNCAPVPAGIVSWWAAEGNANDSADSNNGLLLNGLGFTSGEVGQAFSFDGIDDRILVSNSPSLNFGPGQNFSIEAWIRPIPSTTDFDIMSVVDKRTAPDLTHSQGYEFVLSSGRIACRLSDSLADNGSPFISSGPDLRDGNFHHVALTVARGITNGGRLYADGQVVLNFDASVEPGDLSNSDPLRIGFNAVASISSPFKGQIDEVTLYSRALDISEIQSIYNAGSLGKCPIGPPPTNCAPVPSGLVGWWKAEANTLDQVAGNNGTLVGNTTYGPGRVGQAFVFDGSGDGVTLANTANLQLQNLTIEAWVQRSSTNRVSFDFNGGELFGYGYGGYVLGLKDDGHLFLSRVGISEVLGQSITDLAFHHIAVTKNGTNVVFYLDGAASAGSLFTDTFTFSSAPAIGVRSDTLQNSFLGLVDEVSVYNRALSLGEIAAIYNAGSLGKCPIGPPPTNCVPPAAGIVSWWAAEGNASDVFNLNNGTLYNGANFASG